MKKQGLSPEQLEALAKIGTSKEFGVLKDLIDVTTHNLMVSAIKLNQVDPVQRVIEHEFIKGEMHGLKKLVRVIEEAVHKAIKDE